MACFRGGGADLRISWDGVALILASANQANCGYNAVNASRGELFDL